MVTNDVIRKKIEKIENILRKLENKKSISYEEFER